MYFFHFMRRYHIRWLKVMQGAMVAVLLLGIQGGATAAAPKLVVDQATHDLGRVFEDQALRHTFEIKNTGDAPLVIKDIDLDCACSVADYDKTIPPGGAGKIVFSIKPFSVLHQFCKKGKILSNDPTGDVTLQLCGVAVPFIEIQPSHIIRFQGDPEKNPVAEIRLISHQATPLEIKGYETDLGDRVGVTITPEVPGKIFVVRVSNKVKQNAVYKGKVELATSSDKRPQLILRVFADLYPSSATTP